METKQDLAETVPIPEGVEVTLEENLLKFSGKAGNNQKMFSYPKISLQKAEKNIIISAKKATNRENKIMKSWKSHIKNCIRGVQKPFVYKLKICSGHFPMTVSIKGDEFQVKNFFGEKIPRTLKIKGRVKAKVEGDFVTVESVDKELGSQVAADIEQLTRRTGFDSRIFQDGIWIIEKDGEAVQ
ncbi:50S ribosomal protein L6 [Candidatus Woesearchaeota archaeon]|nr:50S ribosomal protein L6 [Candidatus Woesearchaeota archaeon]